MDTIREALEEESRRKKKSSTGRPQGARPSAATLNVLDIANEALETHYNELAGMEGEGGNSESDEDEESTNIDIQAPKPGMATYVMFLHGYESLKLYFCGRFCAGKRLPQESEAKLLTRYLDRKLSSYGGQTGHVDP